MHTATLPRGGVRTANMTDSGPHRLQASYHGLLRPPDHLTRGSAPDPAGGSAPRPRYRLALHARHVKCFLRISHGHNVFLFWIIRTYYNVLYFITRAYFGEKNTRPTLQQHREVTLNHHTASSWNRIDLLQTAEWLLMQYITHIQY